MAKLVLITTLFITGISLFLTFDQEIETIKTGDVAPMSAIKMETTNGEKLSLLDMKKENGLLVIFSCNTCPFVVGGGKFEGWEKDYNSIYSSVSSKKIGMVLVNSNEAKRKDGDSMKDMKSRAKDKNYTMPYALDKNHELADAFGARTTPHVFLFDAEMKLIYSGSIDNTWDPSEKVRKSYLEEAIQEYSLNKTISNPATAPKGCSIKRKS